MRQKKADKKWNVEKARKKRPVLSSSVFALGQNSSGARRVISWVATCCAKVAGEMHFCKFTDTEMRALNLARSYWGRVFGAGKYKCGGGREKEKRGKKRVGLEAPDAATRRSGHD